MVNLGCMLSEIWVITCIPLPLAAISESSSVRLGIKLVILHLGMENSWWGAGGGGRGHSSLWPQCYQLLCWTMVSFQCNTWTLNMQYSVMLRLRHYALKANLLIFSGYGFFSLPGWKKNPIEQEYVVFYVLIFSGDCPDHEFGYFIF